MVAENSVIRILERQKNLMEGPVTEETQKKEFSQRTWEMWLVHSGLSPQANLPASRIGLYTDFT